MHFAGQNVDADTFVLTLPMAQGRLAGPAGLHRRPVGGHRHGHRRDHRPVHHGLQRPGDAAAAAHRWLALQGRDDLSGLLLGIRRSAIVFVLLLGYLYFRLAGEAYALVSIGLISFAAVAQFAPAMIGGMYWRGGTREGRWPACRRLCGVAVHAAAAVLRQVGLAAHRVPAARAFWPGAAASPGALRHEGPRSDCPQPVLEPARQRGGYVCVSLMRSPNAIEAGQATLFVDVFKQSRPAGGASFWRGSAQIGDLLPLIGRFIGRERARGAFTEYARSRGAARWMPAGRCRPGALRRDTLAGAIGSASARVMVASVVKEEPLGLDEVMNILDEASQVRAYSKRLNRNPGARSRHRRAAQRQRAPEGTRPPEGRLHVLGDPRAAHAAHFDPRLLRDAARRSAHRPGTTASAS
jgi:hypothetical protein